MCLSYVLSLPVSFGYSALDDNQLINRGKFWLFLNFFLLLNLHLPIVLRIRPIYRQVHLRAAWVGFRLKIYLGSVRDHVLKNKCVKYIYFK